MDAAGNVNEENLTKFMSDPAAVSKYVDSL
jgi:hypothetical protein